MHIRRLRRPTCIARWRHYLHSWVNYMEKSNAMLLASIMGSLALLVMIIAILTGAEGAWVVVAVSAILAWVCSMWELRPRRAKDLAHKDEALIAQWADDLDNCSPSDFH